MFMENLPVCALCSRTHLQGPPDGFMNEDVSAQINSSSLMRIRVGR